MDAGIQRGNQRGENFGRDAGAADRQHRRAGEHDRANDIGRQRIADRAAAPFQQLALEGSCIAS